ncbi:MAG: alanyl-tRNA editing protein [Anaerolineae bacterium]|nr:alanyl-tRNA editing protein [Anaerolineae bacterium]
MTFVDAPVTQKLFWADPYQTQLDTHITSVNGNDVAAAQTIFYAFSGGQESDAGTFNQVPVLEARKEGQNIVYSLAEGHGFKVGDPITMQIDWERRYRMMRLHFAAEIILELVYQQLKPITKIGAHIAQDKSRIDFEWGENISQYFPVISEKANALVAANLDIISAYSDEATQRRYWEITGFARVPCGGTHLRRTGEVGSIQLKRKNVGKGKERIEITVT